MSRELTQAELYAFVIIMCLCGGYFLGESYLHFFFSRDLTHEPSQFDRMVDTMFGGALLMLMTVLIVFTRLFMLELEAESDGTWKNRTYSLCRSPRRFPQSPQHD